MSPWVAGIGFSSVAAVMLLGWHRVRFIRVVLLTLLVLSIGYSLQLFLPLAPNWTGGVPWLVVPTWWFWIAVTFVLMFDLIWILDRNLFGLLARFQSGEGGGEKEHKEARRDKEIFQRSRRQFLPLPKPRPEDDGAFNLFIGEACDIETGYSAEEFIYLPERGLFTNTIVFGSVGSAKTAGLLYPLLRQMIDYAQDDPSERIGGLIFDAKDDFSRQARSFLEEAGRGDDFVYLTIDGDYILNPVNDPDMPGMVTASLIASLNDQVIGKSKEGFWKGSYIQLLQQLVTGCQVGFDYTNLIYLPAFASDIDTGARIVNYISHLCGAHGEQEGTLLVYRNLLTNTDTPWEYDQEHRERKLVNVAGNLSLRAAANPDDSYQAFVEACSSVRLEQDTLANALQVCFEREEGLPESYEIERAALNEVHANVYPVFSATFLNPYSRDKAAAIEAVCDLFGISGNYESVKNPFEGRLDPFTHDYYNYKLTYIHLTRYEDTQLLRALLQRCSVHYLPIDTDRIQRAEVFFTWWQCEWNQLDHELRFKIYTGVKNVVQFFEDPQVRRTFAPSMVCYFDHLLNPNKNKRRLFPNFDWLMSEGKWLCVGIPKAVWQLVTDIFCTLIKQQFQCVALQRTSHRKREKYPDYNWERKVCLMIDEYHVFATCGNTMDTDNNFLSLNRQCKVFFLGSSQSIENIKGKVDNEDYVSQILSCCRNKIFLGMEDPKSARYASELIGKGLVYRLSQSVGENQSDSPYSIVAGGYAGDKAGTSQSISYQQTVEPIVLEKAFMELRSFQGVSVLYDGDERFVTKFYCKPYWRPFHESFHWQTENGHLKKTRRL